MNYIIILVPLLISILLSIYIMAKMRLVSKNGALIPNYSEKKGDAIGVEIGGLSLFPVLLISLCVSLALPYLFGIEELRAVVEPAMMRIMQIIVGCSILYIVGLKNDLHGTDSRNEFFAILLTSAMFPATGLWIDDLNGLFGIHEVPAWVGMPVTVLLAMYLTTVVGFLDGIDGLGAGLCVIMALVFLAFCIGGNFQLGIIVAGATFGVALPFVLRKIFSKAWRKTLLGSCGDYVIGYIIAYLTLALCGQSGRRLPEGMLMVSFGIVLVPAFDAIRVLRNRVRENRGVFTPDRNMMQHRLIRTGITPKWVPLVIVSIIFLFAAMNSAWVLSSGNLTVIFFLDIVLWSLLQLGISYAISSYETRHHRSQWNMEYGREAWEADVPRATMKLKRENYGTMGLPSHVIQGEEIDFIPDGMNAVERVTKRIIDMLTSAICLVVFSPLFLFSYLLIKFDDRGPAIYSQERIGRFGRPFKIYKFRSMRTDAEKFGPALSHAGGDEDPRLTKVGRFLRAHHLDELPQLWNVLVGDMAFIGYRPERKFYIDQIMENDPRYAFLYQIRPGVTSYATLYNGYTDTMEKMLRRLELDLYYLGHRSWWLDVKILFLTFTSIIFGKKF